MNFINYLLILFVILWQFNCQKENDISNEDKPTDSELKSLDLICFLSFPNAITITDDKKIYLFFHKHFWILEFDKNTNKLVVPDSNATLISDKWHNLPNDIDFGFTVEKSSYGNPIGGHTFFVKGGDYYLYKNQIFNKSGKTKFWKPEEWVHWRYIVTLRNSSLVLVSTKKEFMSSSTNGVVFGFDHEDYPEHKSDFTLLTANIRLDPNALKFLFPLPFENKYLAVFKYHGEGFYCILQSLSDQCIYEPIHQIFNCSADILLTKQKDWIYWVWKVFKLNIGELLIIISGSSLAVLFINLMLFIISFNRYIENV